ncbi:MAG: leishmanolysin-related zinc metalloendopeptidase [Gemmatimonas sp.]
MRWLWRAVAGVIVATAVAACGGNSRDDGGGGIIVEPPPPPVPTTLEANSNISIAGVVGTAAPVVPSVTLRDASRKVMAGVYVRFTTSGGGKIVNDSSKTDASGVATSGTWTLGTAAGIQTVSATTATLSAVTFTSQVAPGAVQRIAAVFTTTQQAAVNSPVALAPSVRAFDQFNNVVSGVTVTFSIVSGGGTIAGAQKVTGADGVATLDSWKLGTTPGSQQVRADATGASANVLFSAVAVVGSPATLALKSGNGGSGVSGAPLEQYSTLPAVVVTDAFNNPVSGVAVAFTPGANSGTVVGSPVVTNVQGIASPTSWVLGTVATQSLVASSAAVPGVQVVFSASAIVTSFDITVRYIDYVPSARQQLAVTRAITRWKSVIVGSIGSSRVKLDAQNCGRNWTPAVDEMVTNVLVLARIGPIDGAGGIAGDAGPCVLHNGSGLTAFGTMYFDSADLASLESSGLVDALVAHEMGHVLGVGSLWSEKGVLTDLFTNDPYFTGASGLQQFALLQSGYSGRPVPVENVGGGGTAGSHWRESVFRNELMTGYLNSGANPLSRVTVGSLKDLGYDVSFPGAEAFTLTSVLLSSPFSTEFGLQLGNDMFQTQLFTADKQGRLQKKLPH